MKTWIFGLSALVCLNATAQPEQKFICPADGSAGAVIVLDEGQIMKVETPDGTVDLVGVPGEQDDHPIEFKVGNKLYKLCITRSITSTL